MRPSPQERPLVVWSSFEFDLENLQLRKRGLRLRLEEKPAKVLACLLGQAGQPVERGELVKLLWPDEVQGDFDHRLNKAIHKLRNILGDDRSNPRFIQTLSRNGYRFIASVEFVNGNGSSSKIPKTKSPDLVSSLPVVARVSSTPTSVAAEGQPCAPSTADAAVQEDLSSKYDRRRLSWALTTALIFFAAIFFAKNYHISHSVEPHRTVAVLRFANVSGNPADQWLSPALADWLTSELTADGRLRAVSRDAVSRFRSEQGLQDLNHIGPGLLNKITHDLGTDLVVSGTYASSGSDEQSRIRIDLQIYDSHAGRLLFSATAAGVRAEIFDLAGSAGLQLRRKLGLPALGAAGLSSMRSMLPSNPDAARFYAEGTQEIERFDPVDARILLERAVALEPEHALSHAVLSTAYTMLGFSADARKEAKKAIDLDGSLATEQRLLVEGQFHEANYEWDKAIETYSRLFQLFPDSAENGLLLAQTQTRAGKPLMALETIKQLRESHLASDDDARVDILEAKAASCISDFRRQRDAAARAADTARNSSATLLLARAEESEGEALRALGNVSQALALWADAKTRYTTIGDRAAVARLMIDEGRVHWQRGDPQAAEASYSAAVSLGKQIGDDASLGRALTALAQVRMFYVSSAEGKRLCEQALRIFRTIGDKQDEAYALSIMGDIVFANHEEAIKLYQQSLELSREVNDRSRTAGRLMDLGIQATVRGDLASAERDLQESSSTYHDIGERNREALQYNLLSIVRTWQGKLDDAEKLSIQAVSILASVGETVPLAQSRQTLARVQMEQGRFTDAHATLELAIKEHEQANNPGGLIISYGELAEVFLREGKLIESKAALRKYDEIVMTQGTQRPSFGEYVTDRTIVGARILAANGQFERARSEAILGVNQAVKADQGSMLMKAKLALGEIELLKGDPRVGQRQLEVLVREADKKGYGLIGAEAQKLLQVHGSVLKMRNNTTADLKSGR